MCRQRIREAAANVTHRQWQTWSVSCVLNSILNVITCYELSSGRFDCNIFKYGADSSWIFTFVRRSTFRSDPIWNPYLYRWISINVKLYHFATDFRYFGVHVWVKIRGLPNQNNTGLEVWYLTVWHPLWEILCHISDRVRIDCTIVSNGCFYSVKHVFSIYIDKEKKKKRDWYLWNLHISFSHILW